MIIEKEFTMFIVKRRSLSGGTEYLMEGVTTRYRWDKKQKTTARVFKTKRAAFRNAKVRGGRVEKLV